MAVSLPAQARIPAARSFQFDDSGIGEARNSVNMFRGDAMSRQTLLSLDGRNGLDINVIAFYDSSIDVAVQTCNRDRPTGVLGLGWSLPFDAILVDRAGTGAAGDDQFYLVGSQGTHALIANGVDAQGRRSYQTLAYQFWDITYDTVNEAWDVVHEDGIRYRFGGKATGRNTLQQGVAWGNWIGASGRTLGQTPVVIGWNLAQVVNPQGDTITWSYRQTLQSVEGGLSYTKACYVDRIVDTFGRTIVYQYGDKVYDFTRGILEYQDPNRPLAQPSQLTVPNAYQSRYETLYLDSLVALDTDGSEMFRVTMTYELANYSSLAPSAAWYPALYKRYLTSLTQVEPDGSSLPGTGFAYWPATTAAKANASPGALRSVVNADGGVVTYTYAQQRLTVPQAGGSAVSTTITSPIPQAKARVWHGPDYTVVTWLNETTGQLALSVYRWAGRWSAWPTQPQIRRVKILPGSLVVGTAEDFFCLSYLDTAAGSNTVVLYRKDRTGFGLWTSTTKTVAVTGAAGASPSLVGVGDDFVVLCNPAFTGGGYAGWSYDWHSQSTDPWLALTTLPTFPVAAKPRLSLASGRNYFVAGSFVPKTGDSGTLSLQAFYRDPAGTMVANGWVRGGGATDTVSVFGASDPAQPFLLTLAAGTTFVAATMGTSLQNGTPPILSYQVRVYSWDQNFRFTAPQPSYQRGYTARVQSDNTTVPVFATGVIGGMIVNSGNMIRYLGGGGSGAWVAKDRTAADTQSLGFNYSVDVAVVSSRPAGGGNWTSQLVNFDPNNPSTGGFATTALPAAGAVPVVTDQYLLAGSQLFLRNGAQWQSLPARLAGTPDPASIAMPGSAYVVYNDATGTQTYFATLGNGTMGTPQPISGPSQRIFAAGQSGPGTSLAGALGFAAFPAGQTLDSTQVLYLHAAISTLAAGTVIDRAVVQVAIDDGFDGGQPYLQAYAYDTSTATYDTGNGGAQYAKVDLQPGADPRANGYGRYYFSNGYATLAGAFASPGAAVNFNRVLNGQLLRQEVYDANGAIVSYTQHDFTVYTTRQSAPGGAVVNVAGGWVRPPRELKSLDGVSATKSYQWDMFSGLMTQTSSQDYGSTGTPVTVVETTTYAYQIPTYAQAALASRQLTAPAVQGTAANGQPTALAVRTYESLNGFLAPFASYRWDGTGSNAFDFSSWATPGAVPANWVLGNRVTARTATGALPIQVEDVQGRTTSTVYDSDARTVVATFGNARLSGQEAVYYGFEPYETNPDWTLPAGGLTSLYPCTGSTCLQLPAGSASAGPALAVSPQDQSRPYLLTYNLRTAAGFVATPGAGWSVAVSSAGTVLETLTAPFAATNGAWSVGTVPVDVPALRRRHNIGTGQALTLRFQATNAADAAVFLDNLRFSPLACTVAIQVYDLQRLVTVATVDSQGNVVSQFHDNFRRPTVKTGPDGGVAEVVSRYLSRQDASTFQASAPNSLLTVTARGAGAVDAFSGNDWSGQWQSANPAAWAEDPTLRALVCRGGGTSAISFTPSAGFTRSGARIQVTLPAGTLANPVGLAIGSTQVTWDVANGWRLWQNGTVLATATAATPPQGEWLLLAYGTQALFFFGGRPIFGRTVPQAMAGAMTLSAGDAGVAFRAAAAFADPVTGMAFHDACGRDRQIQSFEGPHWAAVENVYDSLGRPAVVTKPVPCPPTVLGFWSGLVTAMDWSGAGRITGAVADYYAPGGGGFSDDQGYPFRRTRYENSPVSRVVEGGNPGKALAIDLTVPAADRHTKRTAYAANTALTVSVGADSYTLPAKGYFSAHVIDSNGTPMQEVRNAADKVLAKLGTITTPGGTPTDYQTWYQYDLAGNLTRILQPNAFATPTGSQPQHWSVVMAYDFFGRMTSRQSADAGTTTTVYNRAGQARFTANPVLTAQGMIAYCTYDSLGRMLEEGLYPFVGTAAQLQAHADDPAWPPAPATWCRRFTYDGSGADPSQLMRMIRIDSKSAAASATELVETVSYDVFGNVRDRTTQVAEVGTAEVLTGHDRLGNVTAVTAPGSGGSIHAAYYSFDDAGRIRSVGRAAGAADYGTYTYLPGGLVATETLAAAVPVRRTYAYASPAWDLGTSDPAIFVESLRYLPEGSAPGYYDGSVAASAIQQCWPGGPGTASDSFSYDGLSRLVGVVGSNPQALRYDANGNIVAAGDTAPTTPYAYYPGTNRLRQVGAGAEIGYDGNGSITSDGTNTLTLDPFTGLTATASSGGATLSFAYTADGQRVLKVIAGGTGAGSILYSRGDSAQTVLEVARQSPGSQPVDTFYVYGPGGLIAFETGGACHFVVKDHVGSARVVTDAQGGVVASYQYSAFGAIRATTGDAGVLRYLYTGQEWDAETRLYNYRARLYDPVTCRFYGVDPAWAFASPYLYSANNPLRYTDPSGKEISLLVGFIIALIIGAVAGLAGGIAMAVANDWSPGEAAWKILAMTALGAVLGGLSALVGAGGAALGGAIGTALGAKTAGTVIGSIVAGTAFGAAAGAAQSAASGAVQDQTGDDFNRGVLSGAISGAVGGFIGSVGGAVKDAIKPTYRVVTRAIENDASRVFQRVGRFEEVVRDGRFYARLGVVALTGVTAGVASGLTDGLITGSDAASVATATALGATFGVIQGGLEFGVGSRAVRTNRIHPQPQAQELEMIDL